MRIISASAVQERIIQAAGQMACDNIALAKQGKADKAADEALIELMFIHDALPYWNTMQIKQKECYLNGKYGI